MNDFSERLKEAILIDLATEYLRTLDIDHDERVKASDLIFDFLRFVRKKEEGEREGGDRMP